MARFCTATIVGSKAIDAITYSQTVDFSLMNDDYYNKQNEKSPTIGLFFVRSASMRNNAPSGIVQL